MKYGSAWWLLSALSLGCASLVPLESDAGRSCGDVRERCTCEDGRKSALICEDDALVCDCPPSKEDAGSGGAGRTDAGRDAGRVRDASRMPEPEPQPDAAPPEDASVADSSAPQIPPLPEDCPEIKTGVVEVLGQRVALWVGEKQAGRRGPILFYWHGSGSNEIEAKTALGDGNAEILAEGGVIAAFTTSTARGTNTGSDLWYTGDFEMADRLLACAIAQQDVDPARIYTGGCSAGGLQASAMVYARSSYLAAAMPNSGGTAFPYQLQDPTHVPAFIGAHGAAGRDKVVLDFAQTTGTQVKDLAAKGAFTVVCDHGGGNCASTPEIKSAQWRFLKDHPFKVDPDPYADGLPPDFPSVCKIVAK